MSIDKFAARLKELREAKGLTQATLAEAIGTTIRNVSRLETGVQEPTWEAVVKIAAALGVSCEAFQEAPATKTKKPRRGRPKNRKA